MELTRAAETLGLCDTHAPRRRPAGRAGAGDGGARALSIYGV